MVKHGEHAESIITNCSSATKGNHAIFLPPLCINAGKATETSLTRLRFVSPAYLKTVKKTTPNPIIFQSSAL